MKANLRFILEGTVGILVFVSVILFGDQGGAVFALMALIPIIVVMSTVLRTRRLPKADERERLLFYQTGNFSLGFMILAMAVLDQLARNGVFVKLIQGNWFFLSVAIFIVGHSFIGLMLFQRDQRETA